MPTVYDKSAASVCFQVASSVPNRFLNLNILKCHKNANSSTTAEATEKFNRNLKSLEFWKILMCV
jgi:hypothetical protein